MEEISLGIVGLYRREFDKGFTELDRRGMNKIIMYTSKIKEKYNKNVNFLCADERGEMFVASTIDEARSVINKFISNKISGIIMLNLDFGDQRAAIEIASKIKKPILLLGNNEEGVFGKNPVIDSKCGTLMVSAALKRQNIKFVFGGFLYEKSTNDNIHCYIKAVYAIENLTRGYVCSIGNTPNNFNVLDVDDKIIKKEFGISIERYSWNKFIKTYGDMELQKIKEIARKYDWIDARYFQNTSSYLTAVLNYKNEKSTCVFAVDCWEDAMEMFKCNICAANAILMDLKICVSCENDIMSSICLWVLQLCSGYKRTALFDISDYNEEENLFLLWHCGNGCISYLKKESIQIMYRNESDSLTYGLIQGEVSEMKVTLLTSCYINNVFSFLVCEGIMCTKRSEIKGSYGFVRLNNVKETYEQLIERGATQHIALVEGECMSTIRMLSKFLKIKFVCI